MHALLKICYLQYFWLQCYKALGNRSNINLKQLYGYIIVTYSFRMSVHTFVRQSVTNYKLGYQWE